LIALLLLSAACLNPAPALTQGAKSVDLVLFYGRGCPHCAAMQDFLQMMKEKYPTLHPRQYEVYFNAANDRLFERMADAYRVEILGYQRRFWARRCSPAMPTRCGRSLKRRFADASRKAASRR
jgi:thiol-disulfide isomerase/thioredoxin